MEVNTKILYDDQLKSKKREKILRRLQQNKSIKGVHFIVRVKDNMNLLHIVDPRELERMKNRELGINILGMADNHEGAVMVVQTLVEKVIETYGQIDGPTIDKEFDINWD